MLSVPFISLDIFFRCRKIIREATSIDMIKVITLVFELKSVKKTSEPGNAAAPSIEPKETYRDIDVNIRNVIIIIIKQRQSTISEVIAPTATPLPPLNLKKTGKQ